MIKFAIPTILASLVLVTGIFAFMPVDQASTVHTTIQNTQMNQVNTTYQTAFNGVNQVSCVSDADFIIYTYLIGGDGETVEVDDGTQSFTFQLESGAAASTPPNLGYITLIGEANTTVELLASAVGVEGWIGLITEAGATQSCDQINP